MSDPAAVKSFGSSKTAKRRLSKTPVDRNFGPQLKQ
jgi:hypothetical protein